MARVGALHRNRHNATSLFGAAEHDKTRHTDVWVSMGEPESVWAERIKLLTSYRVTSGLMAASGNQYIKFMHCLPAFHNRETQIGEKIFKQFGSDCIQVTEELCEPQASVVFDQAENRMHTIKALLVATIGS